MDSIIAHWTSILHLPLFGNTVQAYSQALLNFCVFVLFFSLFKRFALNYLGHLAKQTTNDFDDFVIALMAEIGMPVFITIAVYFVSLPLTLSPTLRVCIQYITVIVLTIRAIYLIQKIVQYGIGKFYKRNVRGANMAADAMIKSVSGMINIIIWILGLIFILDNMGINVSALVAGIGIGGVAVALASQAVLGDAFSAVTIFFDRPFEIGDFIILDSYMGTVEHIGIRTTRIRSLWGEQLIISNSDLTKTRIRNFKRMGGRYTELSLNVSLENPLEKVTKIPDMIRGAFETIREFSPGRINLKTVGPDSFVFEFVFNYNSPDLDRFMTLQQDLYFKILERFRAEGITLAYPARTLQLPTRTEEPSSAS